MTVNSGDIRGTRCAEWWVRHAWGFRSVAVGLGHFLFAPPGQVGDVALSLVTNAPRVNADMMLAELGMDEIFGDGASLLVVVGVDLALLSSPDGCNTPLSPFFLPTP